MVRIRLFGELAVWVNDSPLVLPASRKACALLAWLAAHPGAHLRSRLAAEFWPEVLDASARASLRSAIWTLRSHLGAAGDHLHTDRDNVSLIDVEVDLHDFDRVDPLAAERLSRDELLHRFDAEWVLDLRERYEDKRAALLGDLAARAEAAGDLDKAAEWARQRASLRPLDEAAGREVIRLLTMTGERSAAVAAYTRLAGRLRTELNVLPAKETSELVDTTAEVSGQLVGRDREIAALLEVWNRTAHATGATIAISGDGGIGKTRLTTELMAAVTHTGALTATGTATLLGGTTPFGPWTELIDDLTAELGPLPQDKPWAAELARVLAGAAPGRGSQPATEPGFDRIRFFEAVVELIAWACRERAVLLVVEDVQLADSSTVELVAHVGRRIVRMPVVLVVTRRRLPPRADVDAVLGALRGRGALAIDLEVRPLEPSAVGKLVRGTVPDAEVAQIVSLADGNPLIALESARDPVAGVQGAIRAAISRLRGPARLFVEFLAVAGRDLDQAELAQLPIPGDPVRAATEALGAGLLRTKGETIGFRHALLSEAVYNDLAAPLRARLHAALADALRRRAGRNARRSAAEIARHLRLAGKDHLAVAHLVTAAAHARTVSALAEAAALLTEAAEIEPDDPDPWVELAEVQAWRGLLAESDTAFDRAIQAIPVLDTAARAGAWLRRGRWLRGGICHPRESQRSYRAALDMVQNDTADPLARVEVLAGVAWAESVAGDPAQAEHLLDQAAAITREHGTTNLLNHDLGCARGHALLRAGRFVESYAPLVAAAAAATRAGRPDMAYSCMTSAASAAACAGEFDRALEFADRCLPLVVPNGLIGLAVYAYSAQATVLRRLGRLAEASAAVDRAAMFAERIGLSTVDGLVHYDRGMLAHDTQDWATAAAELEKAIQAHGSISIPLARLHRANALAWFGKLDEAEAELRATALEPLTPADFPDTLVARMARVQARIALNRGDLALARKRLREAERGWRGRIERDPGARYVAALIDLGRPPISVFIEPDRELAAVLAELEALGDRRADVR
ncbi:AAA family ATPase [Actinocrispum sp. NPDC049592]|uniref:ATP-binding protein n=1 Tax=Actinocrispum sp. NPDC049592 TaxID=3154835 RepID=UPI00342D03BF